jgi:MFS transporter, FSR family, fosmidomycin resistance protein
MLVPALLGVAHAIVDASTVTAVMRASHAGPVTPQLAFAVVLGYDVIAFGSQVVFGWLTDRYSTPKLAMLAGLALTLAALGLYPVNPLATMICAGLGNALFHLGAGASVLRGGLDRAAPAGIYVAPGALGLGFGLYYGSRQQTGSMWPLLLLVVVALLLVARYRGLGARRGLDLAFASGLHQPKIRYAYLAVSLLLVSIAVRSLVGLSAARGYARTELLVLGIPLAAFLGKSLGGYLADRLGWIETSVVALLLSIPPIVFAAPALWLLVGLFVFQMTMPVTLTAVARLLPHRLATAFGWTCLALIIGALPTMLPGGSPLCARPLLGLWIAIGTLSVYAGLRLLGIEPRIVASRSLSVNVEMKS